MATLPWQRYWYPEGTEISLNDRDFLPDPSREWARFYNRDIHPLQEITDSCAILLGEPGVGKSIALRQYVDAENAPNPDSVLLLDLNGYSSDHAVEQGVFQHPRVAAIAANSEASLILCLDSLDELLLNEPGAGNYIARRLMQLQSDRLKLRIVCRRAEWIPSLQTILAALYGSNGVHTYRLAPLTAADVVAAANSKGINGEEFLEEVIHRSLQPFARKPFTLIKFLLAVFQEQGGFPACDADLYGRGCLLLARETNPSRLELGEVGTKTDVERIEIAQRIAVVSVLAARQRIAAVATTDTIAERLTMSDLIGPTTTRGDTPLNVASIREVLATALFSRLGPNDAGFDHRSLADYLAAAYIVRHNFRPRGFVRQILARAESEYRVPPQLVELAAWLSRMGMAYKEEILRIDPVVLLRSDISSLSQFDRKRLANGLIDRMKEGVIEEQLTGARLDLLAHEDLSQQIRPLIGKGNRVDVRRVAIDIIEANSLADLVPQLQFVGRDSTESDHIRAYALRAISEVGSRHHKRAAKEILDCIGADTDDEIRGAVLMCAWPDALTTEELFRELTPPKNPNLYGTYAAFLHRLTSDPLLTKDERLITAGLAWISERPVDTLRDRLAEVRNQVVRGAWARIDVAIIANQLAEIVANAVAEHSQVIYEETVRSGDQERSFSELVRSNSHKRRQLLRSLLPIACARNIEPDYLIWGTNNVVQEDDIGWLIELARTSTQSLRIYILDVIATAPRSSCVLDQIANAIASKDLGAPFDSWLFVPFDSEERGKQRKAYAQFLWYQHRDEIRTKKVKAVPDSSSLAAFVAACNPNDSMTWMRLALRLMRAQDTPATVLNDAKIPAEDNGRLIEAAKGYLRTPALDLTRWVNGNHVPNGAIAAHIALEFLWESDSQYLAQQTGEFWTKWSLLLVWYPFAHTDPTLQLARFVFTAAPDAAADSVIMVLSGDSPFAEAAVLRTSAQWRPTLEALIVDCLEQANYSQSWATAAVRKMIRTNNDRVVRAAMNIVQGQGTHDEGLMLASELVQLRAREAWPYAWKHISSSTALGRALLRRLVERSSLSYVADLSAADLGKFLIFLVREFPPSQDPRHDGAYTPEFRDEVTILRSALIGTLETHGRDGISALRTARRELKNEVWLDWTIARAKTNAVRTGWRPLHPEQVLKFVAASDPKWRAIAAQPYISWFLSLLFTIASPFLMPGQTLLQQFAAAVNIGLCTLTATVGFQRPIPSWFPLLVILTPSTLLFTLALWNGWF